MQALQTALNRVKAALPTEFEHGSDRTAAEEIKALTLADLTEKTTPGLQAKISNLLALQTQASIITRLSVPGKEADLRAFRSGAGLKAGSWLNAGDTRFETQMPDADFTIAFAMRLNLEPFTDVNPDYMCQLCGERMVNSCTHATLCKKLGSSGRTERHDELKHAFARAAREYNVDARVRVEPSAVAHCRFIAKDYSKDGRRRADVLITDPDGARTYDFVVSNAAASSAPAGALLKAGTTADRSVKQKNRKYQRKFHGVRPGENFFACAAESHGALDKLFFYALRDLVETKVGTGSDIPKSILASRLYERIGVALQKGNAQGILAFRYAEMDQPEDMEAAKRDAVMDKLTTKTVLSLATCDADLQALHWLRRIQLTSMPVMDTQAQRMQR
jgi:hypothetical protein